MKIEKNIPIPPKDASGRKSKFPWDDMGKGDSFLVTDAKSPPTPPKRLIEKGQKFTSRRVEEGFRVWRTA